MENDQPDSGVTPAPFRQFGETMTGMGFVPSDRASLATVQTADELARALCHVQIEVNLSMAEIARRASISQTTVMSVLVGKQIPRSRRSFLAMVRALGIADVKPWDAAFKRVRTNATSFQRVLITGDHAQVNIAATPAPEQPADPGTQHQGFWSDFLQQALSQAHATFRCAIFFTSVGALILLTGACLAIVNARTADGGVYMPILAGLGGLLITTISGAFTVHANKARRHLTDQAALIHQAIQSDRVLSQALQLIDCVEDSHLRDRLRSVTTAWVLGLGPAPLDMTNHEPPQQIEAARDAELN
ncbi:helix-turn-helix domain-containing protein [Nocardia suismassiliense]|uniref:helix-turn-helix domain-containing protein n=1 Tax=Nocardia suismassiliense TaxID=2077092 RepID=UPI00131F3B03|nr:helix-turn-helix transcriptional regulator [Nocardia suismassiliense]